MVDVAQLSISVDTTDLKRGEAALRKFTKEGKLTEAGLEQLEAASRRAGNSTQMASRRLSGAASASRRTGLAFQNASYQVGDFAVQMASGQRASLALAQQLPQLLGGFGMWGAALGALVAIGGALVPVMFDLGDTTEVLNEKIEDLDDAISSYVRAAGLANMSTGELRKKFGSAADGLRSTISLLEQIEQSEAQAAIDGLAESISDLLGTGGDGESRSELAKFFDVNIFLAFTREAREARGVARELTAEFENAQKALADSEGNITAQIAATQRLLSVAQQLADADGERSAAEEALIKQLAEAVVAMGTLEGKTNDFNSALDTSVSSAEKLARLLERASAAQQTIFDPRAAGFDQGSADFARMQEAFRKEQEERDKAKPDAPKGRKGPADRFAADLDALVNSLRTEREIETEWYSESQALLDDRRAMEILGEQAHKDALLDLEREYQERMSRIRKAEDSARLQSISGAFGDAASLMESGNKKLFAIGKAAAIAQATVAGYDAAVSAWDKGMKIGGPPVAAAFTAASLARTGALISSINSTNIGSGAGGGVSTAAPATPDTSPRVALTLTGSEGATYTKQQVRDLINQINEEVESGAIVRLV